MSGLSSLHVRDSTFEFCKAKTYGGAIYGASFSNISLTNVTLDSNYAGERGSDMYFV